MTMTALATAIASANRAQKRWGATWARCAKDRELVVSAQTRILRSRVTLLLPWARHISGGAPPPDDGIRANVVSRLQKGELFLVDARSVACAGTGRLCVVCDRSILPADLQQQIEGPKGQVFAHHFCYLVWLQESDARRKGRNGHRDIPSAFTLKTAQEHGPTE